MSQSTIEVHSPYSGTRIAVLSLASQPQIEKMLQQAHQLSHQPEKRLAPHQRIHILENVVRLMNARKKKLIEVAIDEGGKPWEDTRIEVERAIEGVKIAIRHLSVMGGKEVPMGITPSSTNRIALTQKEPIGVVVAISAFNHPLNLIVHQVIPAIAVGNPVIVKPALTTPLSCLALMEILREAGLPARWCEMVVCTDDLAEKLACDRRVKYLSFVGSSKVGWHLRSKVAPGTRCALEHGGLAPVIIDKISEIDTSDTIAKLTKGAFYHAGQVCVSVQRVYVEESSAPYIANKIATAAKKLNVGDPTHADTDVGPLISLDQVERLETWIHNAEKKGATVVCGGSRLSNNCFQPTVLLDPPDAVEVSQNEIFGPVVCVYSYKDIDQAILRANALPYAFQAGVFTSNIDRAFAISGGLNASAVMINDHTAFRVDWMPFGGRDQSGLGLGGIPYVMEEMTREKMLVFNTPSI